MVTGTIMTTNNTRSPIGKVRESRHTANRNTMLLKTENIIKKNSESDCFILIQ